MNSVLMLKKNEERRLLAGHQWIFSNEIKKVDGEPENGDVVALARHDGRPLGVGLYNGNSLIAYRHLSRDKISIDTDFFVERIGAAAKIREALYPDCGTYRLVHGESDFLPGLIIDRFGDQFVVQTFSVGMDLRLELICDALEQLFAPGGIIERNESPLRRLEQLPERKGVLRGEISPTVYDEYGVRIAVDLSEGHKTGVFLDQRENRFSIRRLTKDARVLDCFCNEGAFGLSACAGGAREVLGIDASAGAIAQATRNASLNDYGQARFETHDAFEALRRFEAQRERFDVVMLDPPSFTRSKKTVPSALKAYREINRLGASIVARGGYLVTSSCSHHVTPEKFLETAERSILKAGRRARLLLSAGAAPDHPILVAMPETAYLKFAVFAVD